MPLKLEEIRSLVLQALKQPRWNQVVNLESAVGKLKATTQGGSQQGLSFAVDGRAHLEHGETALIHEVIWALIIEGILVPGLDDNNPNWPFLRLTEYGERCTQLSQVLPHDPDGYLRDFLAAVPYSDPVILEYLTEALQCFLRNLNRACAVMLGAASEKAILLLIDSYADSIADPNRKAQVKVQFEKGTSIFRKYETFEKGFASVKPMMPKSLTDNADSLMRGVFDLIRNSRNDAGHPASGILVSRDITYSHLRLFLPYCQRIYGLIGWFATNSI